MSMMSDWEALAWTAWMQSWTMSHGTTQIAEPEAWLHPESNWAMEIAEQQQESEEWEESKQPEIDIAEELDNTASQGLTPRLDIAWERNRRLAGAAHAREGDFGTGHQEHTSFPPPARSRRAFFGEACSRLSDMHRQVAEAADRDGSSTVAPKGNNGFEDAAAAYARCSGAAVLQIHRSETLEETGYVT